MLVYCCGFETTNTRERAALGQKKLKEMGILRSSEIAADVAIVGGGVAGSSLAAVLAVAGFHVVLIEREARFRDRVRGESIHPWGVTQIEALDLGDVIRAAGAQILPLRRLYADRESGEPSRWDSIDPGLPSEWSIYHPALQDALLDHARRCGVNRAAASARDPSSRATATSNLRLRLKTRPTRYAFGSSLEQMEGNLPPVDGSERKPSTIPCTTWWVAACWTEWRWQTTASISPVSMVERSCCFLREIVVRGPTSSARMRSSDRSAALSTSPTTSQFARTSFRRERLTMRVPQVRLPSFQTPTCGQIDFTTIASS